MTAATKPIWDTEPCTRCGGTGSYSFNLLHGTRCFKCGGAKIQLSKTGKAASLRFRADISTEVGKVQDGWMVCIKDICPEKKVVWVQMTAVSHADDGWTHFTSIGGNKYRWPSDKTIRAVPSMSARDEARATALAWQADSLERAAARAAKKNKSTQETTA